MEEPLRDPPCTAELRSPVISSARLTASLYVKPSIFIRSWVADPLASQTKQLYTCSSVLTEPLASRSPWNAHRTACQPRSGATGSNPKCSSTGPIGNRWNSIGTPHPSRIQFRRAPYAETWIHWARPVFPELLYCFTNHLGRELRVLHIQPPSPTSSTAQES